MADILSEGTKPSSGKSFIRGQHEVLMRDSAAEPLRTRLVELARSESHCGYRRLHESQETASSGGVMIRRKKRKHFGREGKSCAP